MFIARKTARFVVNKEILINSTVKGHALDISEEGMFIHSHIPFPVGSKITLEFSLNNAEPACLYEALVQNVKPGVGIGIMFADLTPQDIEKINKYIETACEKKTDTRKMILIVDDSQTVRLMFKGCIELMGYTVREAEDGKQALDVISREKPNLVLLDLFMEGMDGFQFLEAVRTNDELKDLKVIILTGTMTPDIKNRVAPFGVLDVLPKMMTTPKKLTEKIAGYLT
jgi:CheY-like chemotaxis protein